MSNLKYRLILIAVLCLASVWFLFPRNVTQRERDPATGIMHDVVVRRVPLRKGLDLQGGMYLALEVDPSKQAIASDKVSDALDRALKTVRTRIDGMGVSEAVVQKAGSDRIIVQLPGITDPERAKQVVQEQAFLEFQITDKTQALDKALPHIDDIVRKSGFAAATPGQPAASAPAAGIQGLLTGVDTSKKADTAKKGAGAKQGTAAKKDTTSADTSLLGKVGPVSGLIQQGGGMPGEYYVAASNMSKLDTYFSLPAVKLALPGKEIHFGTDSVVMQGQLYRPFYVVDAKPIITGDYIKSARPNTSPTDGTIVEFTLTNEGGRKFRQETGKHVNDYMAIVLDERVMGRPPVIQSAIGTQGQITMGGRSIQDAQDLALVLNAGALPVPLRIAETRQIGPSLGADSIRAGMTAGIISILLVVVIMIGYYRFSGVFAVGGLALYVLYTLATLAGFDAVLTLPGMAGFVLSIGIAVDANVLIFERIREELDRGKTIRTSIDEGFRHAMPAIIDSNVSTILTAAVLYQYGSGPVKGFAVTLIAGIVASLVTSIFVVKTFYLLWLSRSRGAQTLSI